MLNWLKTSWFAIAYLKWTARYHAKAYAKIQGAYPCGNELMEHISPTAYGHRMKFRKLDTHLQKIDRRHPNFKRRKYNA